MEGRGGRSLGIKHPSEGVAVEAERKCAAKSRTGLEKKLIGRQSREGTGEFGEGPLGIGQVVGEGKGGERGG